MPPGIVASLHSVPLYFTGSAVVPFVFTVTLGTDEAYLLTELDVTQARKEEKHTLRWGLSDLSTELPLLTSHPIHVSAALL